MTGILNVLVAGSAPSGPTVYDGIVATRGVSPQANSAFVHANSRSGHYARSAITKLRILCPNYYGSETAAGATMSITASVEYPAGVMTGQQILFSGSASGTIPNGGVLLSDYLTITIANGDQFWIRTHLANTAGIPVNLFSSGSYIDRTFMGDMFEDSATDNTMSGAIDPSETNAVYHPLAIIAPITIPSVLILGDSIALGVSDVVDPNAQIDLSGDQGMIARTIGSKFGYSNTGMPGETTTLFLANHTQRLSLLPYCTHVFVNYGTNDLLGDSAATIEGHLTSIYALCVGKTVFQTTIVPRTHPGPWTDLAGQTLETSEGERLTLNSDLLSTFGPAGGVFNTGIVVQDVGTGKWIPLKTTDGIHPDNAGYQDIKASGAINTSLIGTVPGLSGSGSGWADKGTLFTLSKTRQANDTATFTFGSSASSVRGALGLSSGLKYFEIEVSNGGVGGLIDGTTATGSAMDFHIGEISNSVGMVADGGVFAFTGVFSGFGTGGTFPTAQYGRYVYMFAVDFTNKFAYAGVNNVWLNSGVPSSGSSGTGKFASWTTSPTIYPGFSYFNSGVNDGRQIWLRTVNLLYPLPSGYSAWG